MEDRMDNTYVEREIVQLRRALVMEARNKIRNDEKIKLLNNKSSIFNNCMNLLPEITGVGDILNMIADLATNLNNYQNRLLEVTLKNYGYIYKELPNGAKLTEEFIEILEKSELKRLTAKYK
jgi:hypothetical protein